MWPHGREPFEFDAHIRGEVPVHHADSAFCTHPATAFLASRVPREESTELVKKGVMETLLSPHLILSWPAMCWSSWRLLGSTCGRRLFGVESARTCCWVSP